MPERYEDAETGLRVDITTAAATVINTKPVRKFLPRLFAFMSALGADYAYVGACGRNLKVSLIWSPKAEIPRRARL